MNKIEKLLNILNNEEEYIEKTLIYDLLIEFINERNANKQIINKLLSDYFYLNIDKLKFFLESRQNLAFRVYEKDLSDEEVIILLKELMKYDKYYLRKYK